MANGLFATLSAGGTPAVPVNTVPVGKSMLASEQDEYSRDDAKHSQAGGDGWRDSHAK